MCLHTQSDKIHFCSYVTNAVDVFFNFAELPHSTWQITAFNKMFSRHALKWELKIGMQMLITVLIKGTLASKVRNSIRKKKSKTI